ncbi:MAG TPA: response regulator transcription factor [Candidatus Polarisedimenticolia bacterium]|jgi:DNA-binding NarL/FixJ family response regulator|nr:response regulator transcription factor [Candidatus Polarisedimenticolia bacterium]
MRDAALHPARALGSSRFEEPAGAHPIEVAIAAEPPLFRDVLSRALNARPGLRVVSNGHAEVALALKLRPRVLLLDAEALGSNPESVIRRLRKAAPATRILIMATWAEEESAEEALRAGACGIIEKGSDLETLVQAIKAVAAGQVWRSRRTAAWISEHSTDSLDELSRSNRLLTNRERQIMEGVGRDLRNKEIALRLKISEKTVKAHLNNIFRKLKLDSRVALGMLSQSRQPRS